MQNITLVAPKDLSLPLFTKQQVILLLREHGFSQARAARVDLVGAEILHRAPVQITAEYDLTREERTVVCSLLLHYSPRLSDRLLQIENLQGTYNYMVDMTNEQICGRVTQQQMDWFLEPLRESPYREYLPLVLF